jgi:hypothetical protein
MFPVQISHRRRLAGENVKAKRRVYSGPVVVTMVAMLSYTSFVVAFSVSISKRNVATGTRLYDYFEDSRMDGPPSLLNTTSTIARTNRKSAKRVRINGDKRDPENAQKVKALPGTLGDIMARGNDVLGDSSSPSNAVEPSGLVTTATKSGTLANRFGIEHPLDRMALTANGNLQRLVSSYYDAPVQVVVDFCEPLSTGAQELSLSAPNTMQYSKPQARTWERTVHLTVHNQVGVLNNISLGSTGVGVVLPSVSYAMLTCALICYALLDSDLLHSPLCGFRI